ncbi:MAG: zinc ribbon domain-containing protein [Clostridiales bacterium]|nr:zinc ribbon domain-containing protein [Clostridiales bacterium]
MEDRVKELMDRIRGTASAAADACADTARVAGRKAGQIVDVAKLNVQLFDLNGELNDVLRQLGQVMYDAHRGRAGGDESIPDLLARADELNEKIGGMKDRVSALRQSRTCGTCGAVCGREDKFCRSCGQPLE